MKKALIILMLISVAMSASACSWVGRTAGKVQAKVERKSDSMQSGYEEGYQQEKAKTEQHKKENSEHK